MSIRTVSPGMPGRAVPLTAAVAAVAAIGAFEVMNLAASQGSPVKAVAMVVAPAFLVFALLRPDLAGLLVPVLAFSNAGFVLNANYGVPNVLRGVLVLVGLLLLTRHALRHRMLTSTPVLWAGAMFVVVRLLSAAQSPGVDVTKVATAYAYGLGLVVVLTALVSDPRALKMAAAGLVATGAAISMFTVLRRMGVGGTWMGFAGDTPITPELRDIMARSGIPIDLAARVAGPVTDPNFWAQALVLIFPLSLWALRGRSGLPSRALAWAAMLAVVVGILYTQSRGGMIAAIIGAGIWMWFQGGRIRRALVILPVAVGIGLGTSSAASRFSDLGGLTNPSQAADGSIRGRLSENIAAYQMWRDHPVLGIGTDQYPVNYAAYAQRIGLDARVMRQPHNSYLQMAAESGTLGLFAFVGMLITGGITALRTRLRLFQAGLLQEGRLVEAVYAGGVGFAVAAIFLHQAWPDYLWMTLGLIGGAWLLAERVRHDRKESA